MISMTGCKSSYGGGYSEFPASYGGGGYPGYIGGGPYPYGGGGYRGYPDSSQRYHDQQRYQQQQRSISDTSSSDTSSSSDINHSHRRSSRRVRHRLRPVAVPTRKRDFASSECWVSSHDAKCPQKW